ncbi:MAG: hypothetical protein ACN4GR_01520 [Arenicellales bacterium]
MDKTVDQVNALNVEAIEGGAECMGRLADSFEASARRWELIVYPSMVAFILLASYGFFLIYNLTHDISDVAKSVREMTATVTEDLGEISGKMSQISNSTAYMRPMSEDMRAMTGSINEMNTSVSHMQYNMWQLNRNVSAPFNMVDKMMPFGSSRPYGRSNSRITPPLRPRQPYAYMPQPARSVPSVVNQANTTPAAQVTYTYYPYRHALPIRRF